MGDHSDRREAARQSVGVRELKTHAARIVRRIRETHASYLLTHRGRPVGVILPVDTGGETSSVPEAADAAAWETFLRAGRRIEKRFTAGGVRFLSGMRR